MKKGLFFASIVLLIISGCAKKPIQSATAGNDKAVELRVLCYNIHHANPPSKSGLIDIDAIAKVINAAAPDVVALQELDVFTERSGKNLNQAEAIAAKTGMKAYFAKAIDYAGGEYGIAILSKYPMTGMKNFALPTIAETKGEPRVLATAEIELSSGKKMIFACTHLDALRNDANRVLQIQKITEILSKETLPVVLAGDLNSEAGSAPINILDRHYTRSCTQNCGFTIPEINPNKTIDFIAFSPLSAFNVKKHVVIDEQYASDHLPVFAILELK